MIRGKNKVQNPYTLQDMYREYIKQFDEDSLYYIPYSLYKEIAVAFLNHLQEQIVEKSSEVKLPFNLGTLSVVKQKVTYKSITSMPIDWKRSKEEGKQIRHFNDHTGGFSYSFYWSRKHSNAKNKNNYLFKAARVNTRRVAELVKSKENDYFERI